MSSGNNNNNTIASLGNTASLTEVADATKTGVTTTALEVETTNIIATASSDGTNAKDTSKEAEAGVANTLSTLSLTDTTIYTTYSLNQLDSWIAAYHEEAALVCNKIRPLTTAESAILEKLLSQRRGVENSMVYKEKFEEFMAKQKGNRRDEGN